MSANGPSIPSESGGHPFRRRLVAELLSVPRAFFWLGVLWFALGILIDFYPGGEQGWFTIATVLVAFGVFVPQRRYRIAALVLAGLSTLAAFEGHKRGIEYRQFLERRKGATPLTDETPEVSAGDRQK
jgi:hydrogenase/urease accessory protein HupE